MNQLIKPPSELNNLNEHEYNNIRHTTTGLRFYLTLVSDIRLLEQSSISFLLYIKQKHFSLNRNIDTDCTTID